MPGLYLPYLTINFYLDSCLIFLVFLTDCHMFFKSCKYKAIRDVPSIDKDLEVLYAVHENNLLELLEYPQLNSSLIGHSFSVCI